MVEDNLFHRDGSTFDCGNGCEQIASITSAEQEIPIHVNNSDFPGQILCFCVFVVPKTMQRRQCLNNPNVFCYICGKEGPAVWHTNGMA